MGLITDDAVTDHAEAPFTDPMITNVKVLVISDPVVRGRGGVQMHFSANPTIDLWFDFVKNLSIDP